MDASTTTIERRWQTPAVIMICWALVFMLSAGTRQTFGLFLYPMTTALGWDREVFAFAVAVLTLLMGTVTPFMGSLADRHGSGRVILFGGAMLAIGLHAMANSTTRSALWLSTGLVVGLGASATSVSIAIGAVGKRVPESMRSRAPGVVTAGGSIGQMLVLPLAQGLIVWLDWKLALMLLGGVMVLMIRAALGVSGRPVAEDGKQEMPISKALSEASGHRGFWLLTAGFFVCGFHVSFIGVHLPSFVIDGGLDSSVGATARFLIGLFNIVGSYTLGAPRRHPAQEAPAQHALPLACRGDRGVLACICHRRASRGVARARDGGLCCGHPALRPSGQRSGPDSLPANRS